MTEDQWVVTTTGDRPVSAVVSDIASSGFSIDEVLEEIGVITGHGSGSAVNAVRRLPGVADVSPDQPVDLGPPDSPTTW